MAIDITLRSVKGSPLSIPEVDENFTNLKNGIDAQQTGVDGAVAAVAALDPRVDALESTVVDHGNRIVALETGGGGGGGGGSVVSGLFVGYKNANQSYVVSGSVHNTKISYNLESVDAGASYDPAASLFTAPATGWYFFVASVRLDMLTSTPATGINSALYFSVNGSTEAGVSEEFAYDYTYTSGQTMHISCAVPLNIGATVEVRFESTCVTGGLTWQLTSGGEKSFFQGWRLA